MTLLRLTPVILMLALLACATSPSAVPADPSYASDIQTIFNSNCTSCHTSSSPEGSYSLTSYAGALDGGTDTVPNVIAGNADSSRLYQRITGLVLPQMPLGRTPLDTVKTATIRNWINKGAKDN